MGFAIVRDDGAVGRDGYERVVAYRGIIPAARLRRQRRRRQRRRGGGRDLGVADCDDAVQAGGGRGGPLRGGTSLRGFEEGEDGGEGTVVVAWWMVRGFGRLKGGRGGG